MKMKNGLGFCFFDQLAEGLDLGFTGWMRAWIVARGFDFRAPVAAGKVSIQIHTVSVGSFVLRVTIDIQTRNQIPRMQIGFVVFLQPRQKFCRQFDTLGLVTVNSTNKKQRTLCAV
jgi:hypothetical protein